MRGMRHPLVRSLSALALVAAFNAHPARAQEQKAVPLQDCAVLQCGSLHGLAPGTRVRVRTKHAYEVPDVARVEATQGQVSRVASLGSARKALRMEIQIQ